MLQKVAVKALYTQQTCNGGPNAFSIKMKRKKQMNEGKCVAIPHGRLLAPVVMVPVKPRQ